MNKESLLIRDIINNTKEIYMSDSALTTLLDFERVLDALDLYAYENWQSGELIEGPTIEKYFVRCKFMWPYKKMPDPSGGLRLLNHDCEITYQKSLLTFPREIKSPNDFEPGTRVAKLDKTPIWIVDIIMPKSIMNDVHKGSTELESEAVDLEDIELAYEQGLDDNKNNDGDDNSLATQDEDAFDAI